MVSSWTWRIAVCGLVLAAGCAGEKSLATKKVLSRSVLATNTDVIGEVPGSASPAPGASADAARPPIADGAVQTAAATVPATPEILDGASVLRSSPSGSYAELPRRPSAGDSIPTAYPRNTLPAEQTTAEDASLKVNKLLGELEQAAPEKADEFLEQTRQAAASGNLEQTLALWKITVERARRSAPREDSNDPLPSRPRQERRATEGDSPARPTSRADVASADNRSAPKNRVRLNYSADGKNVRTASAETESTEEVALEATRELTSISTLKPHEGSSLEGSANINEELRKLAAKLEKTNADKPSEQLRAQMLQRLMLVLAGESEEGLKPIAGSETIDRKYWRSQLWALSQYFDVKKTPRSEARASQTIEMLNEAADALRERADLEITSPILCQEVHSFANYVEFDKNEFKAGQGVVVYWEARNYASVEAKEGFRTRMNATIEVYDARGDRRHRSNHDFKDDVSRSRRRDFFCAVAFHLPADLGAGHYTLKVVAHDKTSDKIAEKQVRLVIQ